MVATLSLGIAVAIAMFNPPEITHVSVEFPAGMTQTNGSGQQVSTAPHISVDQPFSRAEWEHKLNRQELVSSPASPGKLNEQRIIVLISLRHWAWSSGVIRLSPDDCITSILVNGRDRSRHYVASDPSGRCTPHCYFRLALTPTFGLHQGDNTLAVTVTNKSGPYGLDIIPMYSEQALIAMVLFLWLAIYAGMLTLSDLLPSVRSFFVTGAGRLGTVLFLPCLGLFLAAAVVANREETWLLFGKATPVLGAAISSFAALLVHLDRHPDGPFALRRSPLFAMLSVVAFVYAALSWRWANLTICSVSLLAVFAGFFASVPLRPFLRRALEVPRAIGVTVLAAICPVAYFSLNTPVWKMLAEPTGQIVQGILWLCGIPTTSGGLEMSRENGQTEFRLVITSPDFTARILAGCSGLEGIAFVIFLLSLFVLVDWSLFSKVKRLWAAYLVAVPMVLAVNAVRIASVFVFARWYGRYYSDIDVLKAGSEAFHSYVGVALYLIIVGAFIPAVYSWARRRQPHT